MNENVCIQCNARFGEEWAACPDCGARIELTKTTTTLRTLLSELDRPDLEDAAKQVVQLEIEKLLGRNAREILRVMGKEESKPKWIAPYDFSRYENCTDPD